MPDAAVIPVVPAPAASVGAVEQPQSFAGRGPPVPAPPAAPGPDPDGPVEWADDLVRELGKTGTGPAKLDGVRAAKLARYHAPGNHGKPADHPDRHLTAREALAVLEADPAASDLTRAKARSIVKYGRYVPDAPAARHPADLLPPPPGRKAPGTPAGGEAPRPPEPAPAPDDGPKPSAPADPGVGPARDRGPGDNTPGVGKPRTR